MGPRADLDAVKRNISWPPPPVGNRTSVPCQSSPQPIAIPTELTRSPSCSEPINKTCNEDKSACPIGMLRDIRLCNCQLVPPVIETRTVWFSLVVQQRVCPAPCTTNTAGGCTEPNADLWMRSALSLFTLQIGSTWPGSAVSGPLARRTLLDERGALLEWYEPYLS